MELTRVEIVLIMGFMALAVRAAPQLFFVGRQFPDTWDRLLQYLSYAFICSIISVTLFFSGARFEFDLAPFRALAMLATIVTAHQTQSAVTGMLVGAVIVLLLSWMR